MFDALDPGRLVVIVAWTVGMAILGTVLAGDAVRTWYPGLAKPRIEIPLRLFALVGAIVYVFQAIVAYRLLERLPADPAVPLVVVTLAVVMVCNELWNGVLFRLRSPFAALVALGGFIALLAILLVGCALVDVPSFVLMAIYAVWVVAYDVPWIHGLWRANPGEPHA